MNSPSITYIPRPGTTPETEVVALAAVYRFLIFDRSADRHNEKKIPSVTSTDGDHAHPKGDSENGSKPRPWPK